ncbi:MAG: RagB/SusD family nutrient uptake outer membrane protein [Gemmatimonadaceae bacterium]
MTQHRFTNSIRGTGLALVLVPFVLISVQACTDLDETPTSSITPNNFYRNEAEVIGGLAAVYAQLRNQFPGQSGSYFFNLSEITTDEMIVPTRGSDWFDNGRWLELHRQTWAAASPSGLEDMNSAWITAFSGVARANVVLGALENVQVANKDVVEAELRALRAYYYYQLMDLFGGVPIVTTTEIITRPRNTRAEVFAFIETELKAARVLLPRADQLSAANHGRFTKGAADAILANMYLNARVFTGEVTAAGLQPGAPRWQDAINFADSVLNSGVYTLAPAGEWQKNFAHDNHLSRENIFVVKHLNVDGLGLRLINATLHYNQFTPSPWNGFSTLAEAYNAFDAADQRRQIFLVGPQVNVETGVPVNDRAGKPLVFTPAIGDARQAAENEGARILKYTVDPEHVGPDHSNDFVLFRLGEIYLIKAEAQFELGNTAGALLNLNVLRARVFNPPKPLTSVDRDVILRERLFELTGEGKRRQDLIRHGKYTNQWSTTMLNGKVQREPYRILFPIPQTQIDANPELVQNAGY